ncbi:MAG TPA: hypothetical protein VKV28_16385 [Candidatus Binataceae bacterium]|nr:hypothetical protein [Candidatus Binataceae bacterium]
MREKRPVTRLAASVAGLFLSLLSVGADAQSVPTAPSAWTASPWAPVIAYFADWLPRAKRIQNQQPHWISPLVTTTPRLEEKLRYDQLWQSQPRGAAIDNFGGGKGVDLLPFQNTLIVVGIPAWIARNGTLPRSSKSSPQPGDGWSDENFLLKYRVAAANEEQGNYIFSVLMGISVPSGDNGNSAGHAIFTPALGAGKGYGKFDVQSNLAVSFPNGGMDRLGMPLVWNTAFQYQVHRYFWPEVEVNYTWWPDGARAGLNQVFLTPGLLIGRVSIWERLEITGGAGYQIAVTHQPLYNHAVIASLRLPF